MGTGRADSAALVMERCDLSYPTDGPGPAHETVLQMSTMAAALWKYVIDDLPSWFPVFRLCDTRIGHPGEGVQARKRVNMRVQKALPAYQASLNQSVASRSRIMGEDHGRGIHSQRRLDDLPWIDACFVV
jgi:hypothetical protein